MVVFWFKFHWNLVGKVQFTTCPHWSWYRHWCAIARSFWANKVTTMAADALASCNNRSSAIMLGLYNIGRISTLCAISVWRHIKIHNSSKCFSTLKIKNLGNPFNPFSVWFSPDLYYICNGSHFPRIQWVIPKNHPLHARDRCNVMLLSPLPRLGTLHERDLAS